MLEKAELFTFMALVEVEVDIVESVDRVEAEDKVEAEEAAVAPKRLIFLSTWIVQIIMFHRIYGVSSVVLQTIKITIMNSGRDQKKNEKDNHETSSVASVITLSA